MRINGLFLCLCLFIFHSVVSQASELASGSAAIQPSTAASTTAQPLTGNFDITNNYIFRGISQTSNRPAFQGGFTYTFLETGIYLNLWGSNVNFRDIQGNTATLEMDTIAGITNKIGDHFTYDVSFNRYNYPKTAASYNEFIGSLIYYFLTAQVGFSSNVLNTHHDGTYYNLGFTYDIPAQYVYFNNVNMSGGIGHYSLPSSAGLRSYNDYNLQVSKTISNYILAVQWTDTNGRSIDSPPLKSSHLIGMITVNF